MIPEPPQPKDPLVAALTEKVKSGEMTIVEAAKEKKAATSTGDFHVSQGNNDWYTPAEYIEAARAVMGGIDLDPASSDHAQQIVQATAYFTQETNGLQQEWHGRVWMNPPFSMPLVKSFAEKMVVEFSSGRVQQAVVITNNGTETQWFHSLLNSSKVFCLLRSRAKFYSPDSSVIAARQGQVIFYFGSYPEKFNEIFSNFGAVAYL
jgi:ParB family chromosome partitioning protein